METEYDYLAASAEMQKSLEVPPSPARSTIIAGIAVCLSIAALAGVCAVWHG